MPPLICEPPSNTCANGVTSELACDATRGPAMKVRTLTWRLVPRNRSVANGPRGQLSHDLWLPPTSVTTPIQLLTFPLADMAQPAGKLSERSVSRMNVYPAPS